jgi:hypothetical protein
MEASGAIDPMEGIWLFLWGDALSTSRSFKRTGCTPIDRLCSDVHNPIRRTQNHRSICLCGLGEIVWGWLQGAIRQRLRSAVLGSGIDPTDESTAELWF